MPEETMQQAAQELHRAVLALTELIEREYPSRREVERRFTTKESSLKRWYLVMALILVSSFISFVSTVTTVSVCFLGDSDHPDICEVLPGYKESEQRNQDLINLLTQLNRITTRNDARLDRLEN